MGLYWCIQETYMFNLTAHFSYVCSEVTRHDQTHFTLQWIVHPDPDISEGGTVLNLIFSRPFGSQFALKIGELQGPFPGSAAEYGISVAEAQTSLLAKRS